MNEEIMSFELPENGSSMIKVLGVGGGGSNAVNHMCRQGIKDVDFVVCNTDAQALTHSPVSVKVQIGESLTEGRGAGNKPEVGRQAAIENLDDVMDAIGDHTKMIFITAGMGGGTGTGAAPVIAKAAKEQGLLTVAIVTIPFRFEGRLRIEQAIQGLEEISQYVDSLLVINNEKLREIYGNQKLSEAFSKADDVLTAAAKGIAEIITVPGYVNVDFADVQTVMANSGVAVMGSAKASGEDRAVEAIKDAIGSPLLNNNDITGAESILLNITSGEDEVSMDEVTEITEYVSDEVDKDVLIIWGTGSDPSLNDQISVTVIATGFEANMIPEIYSKKPPEKEKVTLGGNDVPAEKKEPVEQENKEPLFKKTGKTPDGFTVRQKSIDFEKSESTLFAEEEDQEQQERQEQGVQFKALTRLKEENIDQLENQPAFMRKKIVIEEKKHSGENKISRYSLFQKDGNGEASLNSDNAYLHDNVD